MMASNESNADDENPCVDNDSIWISSDFEEKEASDIWIPPIDNDNSNIGPAADNETDTETVKFIHESENTKNTSIPPKIHDRNTIHPGAEKQASASWIPPIDNGNSNVGPAAENEASASLIPPIDNDNSNVGPAADNETDTETVKFIHESENTKDTSIPPNIHDGNTIHPGADNITRFLTKMMKDKGFLETMEYIKREMDKWKTEPVRFALIGKSGVGKSTYINTVRGVTYDMADWAEEGVFNTTTEIKEYEHPKNRNIVFCDVPGYALGMIKDELLKKLEPLNQFDFFLIFIDIGPSEDDLFMVEKIVAYDKPFCLVRTKLDEDITRGKRRKEDPEKIRSTIRQKVNESIQNTPILKNANLFLISCVETNVGEFCDLWQHMKRHLSRAKYEAIMLTLPIFTTRDIDKKFEELKSRIRFVAKTAGVVAAIPIPFLDIPINTYLLKREINIYFKAFQLDREDVKDIPGRKYKCTSLSVRDVLQTVLMVLGYQYSAPVAGSIFAYKATSSFIDKFLLHQLTELKGEAIHIFNFLCQRDIV